MSPDYLNSEKAFRSSNLINYRFLIQCLSENLSYVHPLKESCLGLRQEDTTDPVTSRIDGPLTGPAGVTLFLINADHAIPRLRERRVNIQAT